MEKKTQAYRFDDVIIMSCDGVFQYKNLQVLTTLVHEPSNLISSGKLFMSKIKMFAVYMFEVALKKEKTMKRKGFCGTKGIMAHDAHHAHKTNKF